MHPQASFFDQAANRLREAMDSSTSGLDRMRLIQEALALYHLHQRDLEIMGEDMGAHPGPSSEDGGFRRL